MIGVYSSPQLTLPSSGPQTGASELMEGRCHDVWIALEIKKFELCFTVCYMQALS